MAIVVVVIPALDPLGWGEASPGWVLTRIKQDESPLSESYRRAEFSSAEEQKLRKGVEGFSIAEREALTQSQKDFLAAFEKEIGGSKQTWIATLRESGRTATMTLVASLFGLWLGGMLARRTPALSCVLCGYKFSEFARPSAAKPGT